jgi:hypothetical protein
MIKGLLSFVIKTNNNALKADKGDRYLSVALIEREMCISLSVFSVGVHSFNPFI